MNNAVSSSPREQARESLILQIVVETDRGVVAAFRVSDSDKYIHVAISYLYDKDGCIDSYWRSPQAIPMYFDQTFRSLKEIQ